MNSLPSEYICEQKITKEAIISALEDSKHKKMVRDCISKIVLVGNIQDESIPSVLDEDFNVQAISIMELEVKDKRCIGELSRVLQRTIKNYAILKFTFNNKHVISFALKRLSKKNANDIVVDTMIITDEIELNNEIYNKYINYKNILNKSNKILFYREVMVKCFIISNRDLYNDFESLLCSSLWYENERVIEVYKLFMELDSLMKKKKGAKEHREIVEVNGTIRKITERLGR